MIYMCRALRGNTPCWFWRWRRGWIERKGFPCEGLRPSCAYLCCMGVAWRLRWNIHYWKRFGLYIYIYTNLILGACVQNAVWTSFPSGATSFDSTMSNMSWHHIQWWCMLFVSCWNRYADVFQHAVFLFLDNRYLSYLSLEIYLCVWILTWFMIHLRSYHYLCTSTCYMLLFHWIAQRLLYLYYILVNCLAFLCLQRKTICLLKWHLR